MWHMRRLLLVGRQEFIFKVTRMCFPAWFSPYPKALEFCSEDLHLPSYRKSLGTDVGCKFQTNSSTEPCHTAMR